MITDYYLISRSAALDSILPSAIRYNEMPTFTISRNFVRPAGKRQFRFGGTKSDYFILKSFFFSYKFPVPCDLLRFFE